MSASQTQAQKAAIFVPANGARGYAPLNIFGDLVTVKLSGKDTGGAYAVMENVTQPKAGPPLHVHHREDEGFFVIEGDYIFEARASASRRTPVISYGCRAICPIRFKT